MKTFYGFIAGASTIAAGVLGFRDGLWPLAAVAALGASVYLIRAIAHERSEP